MDKYAVIDSIINEDSYESVFDTEKEAMDYAQNIWCHMTKDEKQKNVLYVIECDLDENGFVDFNTMNLLEEFSWYW